MTMGRETMQEAAPSEKESGTKKPVMPIILGAICGILLIVLVVLVVLAKPWDSGDKNSGKEPSAQATVPAREESEKKETAEEPAEEAETAGADTEENSGGAGSPGETEENIQEGESPEEISKPEGEEAPGSTMENSRSDTPDGTWSEQERQNYYQAQYEDIVETYRLFYNGEISIFDRPQMFQNGVMGRGMYSAGYWTDEDGYCQASDYEEIHMVYLIQDLNLDRIPELVVAEYSKDYDTYLIHDLWTIADNHPVFVDYSDARFDLKPMMEGYFYRTASSGAAYTYFYVYRLSEEGTLEVVESASMEENVYTVNGETVDTVDTVFMFNDTWSPSVIDISTLEWKYLN